MGRRIARPQARSARARATSTSTNATEDGDVDDDVDGDGDDDVDDAISSLRAMTLKRSAKTCGLERSTAGWYTCTIKEPDEEEEVVVEKTALAAASGCGASPHACA